MPNLYKPCKREWRAVMDSCLRRIGAWHAPSHFSASDWRDEMRAHAAGAAWQAVCDYDPALGVPLLAFVRQRVMACALTRYRQEWAYARHCVYEAEGERCGSIVEYSVSYPAAYEPLWCALAWLSEADRWLLKQLFWEGRTEAELARVLGIGQSAVSRRKRAVLREMRRWLEPAQKT